MDNEKRVTVGVEIKAPLAKVWQYWTDPNHIVHWNFASADWVCPKAVNDLKVGGSFNYRMESRDAKMGFDFEGVYDEVIEGEKIVYHMSDGRGVVIDFSEKNGLTTVRESFDAEDENSAEMQRAGWQAILENFKKLVEES